MGKYTHNAYANASALLHLNRTHKDQNANKKRKQIHMSNMSKGAKENPRTNKTHTNKQLQKLSKKKTGGGTLRKKRIGEKH